MSCHVFISYRRKDSGAWAGRIFDRLAQIFPAKSVFLDVDGIEPGSDFSRALTERLSVCKVMLVVIGPNWLATDQSDTRLLDQPNDYVAAEIQAALERDTSRDSSDQVAFFSQSWLCRSAAAGERPCRTCS